jgi:hypothetical protein
MGHGFDIRMGKMKSDDINETYHNGTASLLAMTSPLREIIKYEEIQDEEFQ